METLCVGEKGKFMDDWEARISKSMQPQVIHRLSLCGKVRKYCQNNSQCRIINQNMQPLLLRHKFSRNSLYLLQIAQIHRQRQEVVLPDCRRLLSHLDDGILSFLGVPGADVDLGALDCKLLCDVEADTRSCAVKIIDF
jgi:hypothetical protein